MFDPVRQGQPTRSGMRRRPGQEFRPPGAPSTDAKRDALLGEPGRLGFTVVEPSRKGGAHALEKARPGNTRVVRRLFSRNQDFGEMIYGYYCAVAHPTLYGLAHNLNTEVDQRPGVREGFVTVGLGRVARMPSTPWAWPVWAIWRPPCSRSSSGAGRPRSGAG